MHSTIVSLAAIFGLASVASAAPAPAGGPQYPSVYINLITPDNTTPLSVPMDGQYHPTYDSLSISHVSTDNGPCVFYGKDGLVLSVPSATGNVDVGPPQVLDGVICGYPKGDW